MNTDNKADNREWVSASCEGEKCSLCGKPATNKIAEVIMHDDPNKMRHELTQYVCREHFEQILMPYKSPLTEVKEQQGEPTDAPQIHIQCTDGRDKQEATELVFHKMADGTLFLEVYYQEEFARKYDMHHYQTNVSKEQFDKLKEYLINKTTY